ncbi:MAG: 30S ribosomal protein S3, partial [Candidatus Altiarchaeales archaeon]|nr:30S ribosomal protein S3 [Candidatus Altiarchaeales archaeon]
MAMEKYFIQKGKIRSEMENLLRRELSRSGYSRMDIQKTPLATRIDLHVEKPPIVIGKKGRRINKLTRILEEKYGIDNLTIDVKKIENPTLDPKIVAKRIALALERGMYRRRVTYKALHAVMYAGARGVEISLAGKIVGKGGRSRTEKYAKGYMKKAGDPTNLVDIGSTQAYLKAGVIGVTVRIVPPGVVFPDQITMIPRESKEEETGGEEEKKETKKEKGTPKAKTEKGETREKKTVKKKE